MASNRDWYRKRAHQRQVASVVNCCNIGAVQRPQYGSGTGVTAGRQQAGGKRDLRRRSRGWAKRGDAERGRGSGHAQRRASRGADSADLRAVQDDSTVLYQEARVGTWDYSRGSVKYLLAIRITGIPRTLRRRANSLNGLATALNATLTVWNAGAPNTVCARARAHGTNDGVGQLRDDRATIHLRSV